MQDQWKMVDIVVKAYIKKFPIEWIKFNEEMEMVRKSRTDTKFAKSKTGSMRLAASFPDVLWKQLARHFPKIKKDKGFMASMLKKYPNFRASEKY
jgi:hypothetical protein